MNYLKEWRMKLSLKLGRGITQEKAAEILGYSSDHYRRMECDLANITVQCKKNAKRLLTTTTNK